jgi:16S rRNA (adenine1518-N6/adenine1519-N6)-dimethyltransferase
MGRRARTERSERAVDAPPPVRKSLGQHFLSDVRILGRIVDALAPAADDTVVEIGPGRGALTDVLRERAKRVIAIELDRALAERLRARYAGTNVEVVQADILETDLGALATQPFLLAGNVPYYITTPILFHALRAPRPERAVFLVQREVAERMSATAGEREYGALSVNLQAVANIENVFRIPAGAFQPPPKVDSAVVRVVPRPDPAIAPDEETPFREFVQAVFSMRRKQMRRVVRELSPMSPESADELLRGAGIDPEHRPERVTVSAFAALRRAMSRG